MTPGFPRVLVKCLGPHVAGLFLACGLAGGAAAAEIAAVDLEALPQADVVILGEIHDNPVHQENQARAVAAMDARALVFEMFGPDAALKVSPDLRLDRDELADALGWAALGWPDFQHYHPIFTAEPDAAVFGGAVSKDEARRAVSEGAAAVMGGSAELFGLDQPLDAAELAERVEEQRAAHCDAMPGHLLPGMVEAQRLRDAALARAVVAAMAETGGPVAVITGNGHARNDWGLPRMLDRALPGAEVLSLGQFEDAPDADVPHDLWLVTDPAERSDPCAAFR